MQRQQNHIGILIVDDKEGGDIHLLTQSICRNTVIEGRTLKFFKAFSIEQAKEIIDHENIGIVLLDVIMDELDFDLKIIKFIRNAKGNKVTQIILRTGQSWISGFSPVSIMLKYDINHYLERTDSRGSQAIELSVTSAARSYLTLLEFKKKAHLLCEVCSLLIYALKRVE